MAADPPGAARVAVAGGALGGPIAYDVISGNHTGAYPRYAATGGPAALLLLGVVIGRLPVLPPLQRRSPS